MRLGRVIYDIRRIPFAPSNSNNAYTKKLYTEIEYICATLTAIQAFDLHARGRKTLIYALDLYSHTRTPHVDIPLSISESERERVHNQQNYELN